MSFNVNEFTRSKLSLMPRDHHVITRVTVEFVGVQEASGSGLCIFIPRGESDSRFYRVLLKLGQVCEFPRVQEASWLWSV